ncbi:hypothetical protein [Hugenholtzia roseola]|uniref:hypothetical protein n=1 Tax=Hugenholtzia roseola TaxID=1002 RepID=UPI0012B56C3A|nr:hypothetical protein [Hugenholtzia roseola]
MLVNQDGVTLYSNAGTYAACAESFLNKGAFMGKGGQPYYLFPPFFPILLAISLLITQLPTFLAALWLQVAALWLFSWSLIQLYGRNWIEKIAIILGIVASPVLFKIYIHAFSETVFMALCIFSIFIFEKYKSRKSKTYFVLLCLIASLLPLTRYIGIAFLAAVTIYFLGKKGAKKRYKKALIFSLLSSIPLLFWLLRNYLSYGVLTGGHTRFWHKAWDIKVAETILSTLGIWLSPLHLGAENGEQVQKLSLLIGLFFLVGAGIILGIASFLDHKRQKEKEYLSFNIFSFLLKIHIEIWYVFFYLLIIFILVRLDNYPYYFERLLFPLYPFFGMLLLKSVSAGVSVFGKYSPRYAKWISILLYFGLFFWIFLQFRRTLTHVWIRYFEGRGFSITDFLAKIGDFF